MCWLYHMHTVLTPPYSNNKLRRDVVTTPLDIVPVLLHRLFPAREGRGQAGAILPLICWGTCLFSEWRVFLVQVANAICVAGDVCSNLRRRLLLTHLTKTRQRIQNEASLLPQVRLGDYQVNPLMTRKKHMRMKRCGELRQRCFREDCGRSSVWTR